MALHGLGSKSLQKATSNACLSDESALPLVGKVSVKLLCKAGRSRKLSLTMSEIDTVARLKTKLRDAAGIPEAEQILVFDKQKLADNHALSHYRIGSQDLIYMVLRPTGPCVMEVIITYEESSQLEEKVQKAFSKLLRVDESDLTAEECEDKFEWEFEFCNGATFETEEELQQTSAELFPVTCKIFHREGQELELNLLS